MRKCFVFVLMTLFFNHCSSNSDIQQLTSEEHFQYALNLYNDEDYEEALSEFQKIIYQYPGNPVNDDAHFYYAMSYFKREQFILSAYEFSKLIKSIPGSEYVSEAQFMLAESYYQLSPPYQLDQRFSEQAVEEFQAFIDFFPVDQKVEEAERKIKELNEKLAEKEYEAAQIYMKMEYYNAAIRYLTEVITAYHDTKYAKWALFDRVQLYVEKDRISNALLDITSYLEKYPEDSRVDELRKIQNSVQNSEG